MTVVLVPHPRGVDALSDLGVRPLLYDPTEPLPAGADEAEVLVPSFLSGPRTVEIAQALPKLRLVQLLTAGAEVWVGRLPEGVLLSDGKGAHGGATAEWVVGALLAVYRELPGFVRAQERGEWTQHVTDELGGKRVLVVGAGDVAEHIVRRLTPFDVTTTLVGRRPRDGVHGIAEVHGLLAEHDACVVVVPLTEATRGLVDADFLAAMPDGAVLVNGARGPVADTDALLAELTSGRLRAALDVTDPEPLPAGHPLWEAPGLLLTPHVGGSVPGALDRAFGVVREQLEYYLRGEEPPNVVRDGY
ncbi:2-hydroxyacid dehydrogenase [Pseudonocardia pini]|uniref:2-hydroxyacid dehydrogenase n=1 Tax=Pseudonocardia pini TaxID=2758030 RepID=UPI0015F0BF71|nr:2-hydroxyacid dehydrogenase [Pseudonocardia pini]